MKAVSKGKQCGWGGFVPGLLALSILSVAAWADSSGTAPPAPREWRDQAGRLLKRVDSWGRATLYTHDELGRLVRIDCERDVWTHCFLYNSEGLVAEIDCFGRHHDFATPREIDLKRGTALGGHRHVPPPLPSPRAASNLPETRFEYDSAGRLTTIQTTRP